MAIVKDAKKPLPLSAGSTITIEKSDWTYTCRPNASGEKKKEKKSRKRRKK